MTPAELLESVKLRFPTLIYDDENGLNALLEQTLGTYQDRAGVIRQIRIKQATGSVPVPHDFLSLVTVYDSNRQFVIADRVLDDDGMPVIELELTGAERYPLRIEYLAKLRGLDPQNDPLPDEAIGLLENYLEVLISVRNIDFERRFAIAGRMDVSNLPDENTLYERKKTLELEMTASRAIIPMVCL